MGAITDSRAKFLEWSETVKDRAALFDDALVDAMEKAEAEQTAITGDKSTAWGGNSNHEQGVA